jgi:O-acetylserine/cysteine efflux transporter
VHDAPRTGLTARDLTAAAAVVVIWGLNFVAMKLGLRSFTPFQLGAARFLFAMVPLALWVRPPSIPLPWLVTYGLVQGVGQFASLFFALQVGMTAALASVLMQTQIFFTAILGALMLHEGVGRPLRVGMAVAAAGLCCFAIGVATDPGARAVTAAGLALNLLSAALWAASNIVVRRIQVTAGRYDALALVVWSGAVSAPSFVVLSLAFDDAAARWRWTGTSLGGWLAIAYLGWGSTALAYALWTSLLQRHPASRVAPFSLGVPVVGLLAGVLVLGERVTAWQWAGAALVLSALGAVIAGSRLRG